MVIPGAVMDIDRNCNLVKACRDRQLLENSGKKIVANDNTYAVAA